MSMPIACSDSKSERLRPARRTTSSSRPSCPRSSPSLPWRSDERHRRIRSATSSPCGASQINGCAFCLDMHVKQAKIHGERELRLYHLSAWRESTLFAPRERAALAWTEVLTRLPEQGVPDEIYERVRTQLSEKEISDLTFVIVAINSWNRLNVGFRTVPGSQDANIRPGQGGTQLMPQRWSRGSSSPAPPRPNPAVDSRR